MDNKEKVRSSLNRLQSVHSGLNALLLKEFKQRGMVVVPRNHPPFQLYTTVDNRGSVSCFCYSQVKDIRETRIVRLRFYPLGKEPLSQARMDIELKIDRIVDSLTGSFPVDLFFSVGEMFDLIFDFLKGERCVAQDKKVSAKKVHGLRDEIMDLARLEGFKFYKDLEQEREGKKIKKPRRPKKLFP